MEEEYIVEVRDFLRNIILDRREFSDANTAYHEKRMLDDQYRDSDSVVITLIEP